MAGYNGYSMSNNAVDAYASGEKPKSKWTKQDFIDYAEENCPEVIEKIKKATLKDLRTLALTQSSWHHTSKFYNKTYFYEIDEDYFENLKNGGERKKNSETIYGDSIFDTFLIEYNVKINSYAPKLYANSEATVREYSSGSCSLIIEGHMYPHEIKLSDIQPFFIYQPFGSGESEIELIAKRGQAKLALLEKQMKSRKDQNTRARKPGQGLEKRETQNTKGITL